MVRSLEIKARSLGILVIHWPYNGEVTGDYVKITGRIGDIMDIMVIPLNKTVRSLNKLAGSRALT